jgi:cytochrome c-type protein NapB
MTRPRLAVCSVLLAGSTVIGAAPQDAGDENVVEIRVIADRLDATLSRYDAPDAPRLLFRPMAFLNDLPASWRSSVTAPETARAETLALRASRRAYDGAPPVMPHSRNFVRTKTCLDCHAEGMWLGKRFGPPMSHPHLTQCMQCHVESRNLDLPGSGMAVENVFDGLVSPSGGEVAWAGAPPVMPHATFMRTDGLSCHGPDSYPGLRTDHPERSNCVQCHGTAASLDQRSPFFTGSATLVERPATAADEPTP